MTQDEYLKHEIASGVVVEISLTNGGVTLVDAEDYERLSQSKWYRLDTDGRSYACNTYGAKMMHTEIMGWAKDGFEWDHKNRNGLDNRKKNLRLATRSQNMANTGPRPGKKFKGVHKNNGRFRAQITVDYKKIHLGYFDTEEDAARAYDVAAKEHFGEFAYTNTK